MATRKLLFTGSTVALAGDMNVDELLQAFAEQPIIFEVSMPNTQRTLHSDCRKCTSSVLDLPKKLFGHSALCN